MGNVLDRGEGGFFGIIQGKCSDMESVVTWSKSRRNCKFNFIFVIISSYKSRLEQDSNLGHSGDSLLEYGTSALSPSTTTAVSGLILLYTN